MRKLILIFSSVCLLWACNEASQQAPEQGHYFDVKGYFNKEAQRLANINPIVDKTVMVNEQAERKQTRIEDWTIEFMNFIDADINKSSWIGLFDVAKTDTTITYRSHDNKVPVKELKVIQGNNKAITGIQIILNTRNYLYQSTDTLIYYPDSFYKIKKKQQISLLDEKNYQVLGKFNLPAQR